MKTRKSYGNHTSTPEKKVKFRHAINSRGVSLQAQSHFTLWLSVLLSVCNILPPLMLQYAIDNYILKKDLLGLLVMLVALTVLGGLIAIQSYFQRILSQSVGLNVVKNLRNRLSSTFPTCPSNISTKQARETSWRG